MQTTLYQCRCGNKCHYIYSHDVVSTSCVLSVLKCIHFCDGTGAGGLKSLTFKNDK